MLILLALAWAVAAKNCKNITVPISISSRNSVINLNIPKTEIEVTNMLLEFSKRNTNYSQSIITGHTSITKDYKLATTYCEPENGPGHTLQVLTHGLGFDRSYWDFSYNNYNYSYVNQAIRQGYSTLSWDRLGVGQSSHGDPLSEIQIALETAALKALTERVKDGKLGDVKTKFSKMVHIGHSYGSAITFSLSSMYPNITDGIVLTGFSQNPSFVANIALGGNFAPVKENPVLANKYPEGYLAPKSSIDVHIIFFAPGDFDPKVLDIVASAGQPVTPGEILTFSTIGSESQFGGPVLIITGEKDIPFCGGDCFNAMSVNGSAPDLLEMSRPNFEKASVFQTKVVPGAGHGLNQQYSSGFTYKVILDFLSQTCKMH
ncbi:serine aminopeptidase, s33 domain-containing protein [Hirsutella rhossiliensis]|uniref:Serine aminopeptidase, s33 domain-containing protein n=1 Tax=Hirsutella rhossiliensis TaxID=111463 RepID=A0A9P8MQQ2_9HYPO|nr:serine aminopeptidase, s33 domain-containing protein [Hirsutella rhossiliensis]KAH0959545.1 serine aminopeptidase, s33 domain-containing protein [Hirsutella rhossiliensis]